MPTGYTHGILNGEITNFKEYATRCMKAFGACVHMKDEPGNKKYEPRIPSDYHKDNLKEAEEKLKSIEEISDEELIENRKKELKIEEKTILNILREMRKTKKR